VLESNVSSSEGDRIDIASCDDGDPAGPEKILVEEASSREGGPKRSLSTTFNTVGIRASGDGLRQAVTRRLANRQMTRPATDRDCARRSGRYLAVYRAAG